MAEIRSGFSWPSLLGCIMGVGIICWLAFTATSKTNDENYAKGAQHNETTVTVSPTYNAYPLSVPPICGTIFKLDNGTPITPVPKVLKK